MDLNPGNIWNFAQNKPTLIVEDLQAFADPDVIYASLLRRGVFKWLAVRRDLIKLKNRWKDVIKMTQNVRLKTYGEQRAFYKGYQKAYEECRAEVRALCHSERWRAPDFDKKANAWLSKIGDANADVRAS